MFIYGCRPGEARALCWDAVDFENELIYIKQAFSTKKLVNIPKGVSGSFFLCSSHPRHLRRALPAQEVHVCVHLAI